MKFYYMTKSKGKCGIATTTMRVTEDYKTKTALKKAMQERMRTVVGVWTEEQLFEACGEENAKKFIAEAKPW